MSKYDEIAMEIYRLQYLYATPPANFDELMESGKTKKPNWFMKYYMDQDDQQTIIKLVCNKHKLDNWEKRKMREEINLGCSPNTSYKTWKEARKNVK